MYRKETDIDRFIRISERNEAAKASNYYLKATLVQIIERVSKKLLKMINSKARTVIRLQRARESHRKLLIEECEDDV